MAWGICVSPHSFGRLFPFGGTWGLSEPPFGESLGLTPPFPPMQSTLFSSIPSLLLSSFFSLLTSSPFVQRFFDNHRLSLRQLFPSCSLIYKRNKAISREKRRGNKKHPIVNISFNCFLKQPPALAACDIRFLVVGKKPITLPHHSLYSYSGKRARSFFSLPSKVAAFG